MNMDSVLSLKAELMAEDWGEGIPPVETTAVEEEPPPLLRPPVGVGIVGRDGEYRLAVRVYRESPASQRAVEVMSERAAGEVDVRFVGRIVAQQGPLRPLVLGCSCANGQTGLGTLGCFVKRAETPGVVYVLSNNHVLARENRGRKTGTTPGEPILQPAKDDQGRDPADIVARLSDFVRLRGSGNLVDVAIAAIAGNIDSDKTSLNGLGPLRGARAEPLQTHDRVHKVGRTTGLTHGRVVAWDMSLNAQFDTGLRSFDQQIEIEPEGGGRFSAPGDSGSLIVDDQNMAAGLVFSGSDNGSMSYANQIGNVLSLMRVRLLL